jgi:hypothetical protein
MRPCQGRFGMRDIVRDGRTGQARGLTIILARRRKENDQDDFPRILPMRPFPGPFSTRYAMPIMKNSMNSMYAIIPPPATPLPPLPRLRNTPLYPFSAYIRFLVLLVLLFACHASGHENARLMNRGFSCGGG